MTTKVNQKEAVFQAISEVLGEVPSSAQKVSLSSEQRSEVNSILFEGIRSGRIECKTSYESDKALRSYVSGLQSNWLNKDQRLNGGVRYEAKNPGSRSGSSDPQVKAMRALLKTLDAEDPRRATVEATLSSHLSTLKVSKQKVTVNLSDLPEELRAQFEEGAE